MRVRLGIPRSGNQWILTLLGIAVAGGCAVQFSRGAVSLSWPKVDGIITRSRQLPGYRAIGVDIGYRYTVGDKTYTGSRYRYQFPLTARHMRGRDVQSILGQYRVGEPVKVAVKPGDPADSVLEPGPDSYSMIPFALGLLLLLLGLGKVREVEPVPPRRRYLLAKVLGLSGAALLLIGAFYLQKGIGSLQWPSVEGRIVFSHARGGPHPETLLRYEYYVDNRRYQATSYRNGGNVTPSLEVAEDAAKRYFVGRAVSVYYNPRDPEDALLEPGLWWGNFVTPALGLLLFGAAWVARRYANIMASRNP